MKTDDLRTKPVLKIVLTLAIPAMLAQFINVLYSIIDRLFIANLEGIGGLALSGIGITAPFCTFITSFSLLIGLGGAPLVAMSLGEGRADNAKRILWNSFVSLLVLGIVVPLIIFLAHEPLLNAFGATKNTFIYAKQYLLYYLIGAPFALMALGLNQFLISQGYSTKAMLTMIIGAVTNIALDPLFIYVFHMDVIGAAVATSISQIISFIYVLVILLRYSNVRLLPTSFDLGLIKKVMRLGFSPFIIAMTDSFLFIIMNMSIKMHAGARVDEYINIATIASSFYQLFSMLLLGISGGTGSILSYNYGARNSKRVMSAEHAILGTALVFTSVSFLLSFFISRPFVSFYSSNEFVLNEAPRMIFFFMAGFITLSFQYCYVDGLTALGRAKYSVWLSLFRKVAIIALMIVLPYMMGIIGVFVAQTIVDIISPMICILVFNLSIKKILHHRELETTSVV